MKSSRTLVGVDTAKRVFQLHWVDVESRQVRAQEKAVNALKLTGKRALNQPRINSWNPPQALHQKPLEILVHPSLLYFQRLK